MFDFLKQGDENAPQDVKSLRHKMLQFIKEQLQRWEGGEGNNIRGLQLYAAPTDDEKSLYDGALYIDEGDRLQEEVQRIADDFSIALPSNWTLEVLFVEELPKEATKANNLNLALYISTRKQPNLTKATEAYIKVLNGEAENSQYTLTATDAKVCIGREKKVQTEDGFMRENDIAFPGEKHPSNKFISRTHAHIEWDKETGNFLLFADEGGLPPKNKIKVRPADGSLIKLQTTQIGHPLQEGDQIVLGESALLQFSYTVG